MRTIEKQAFSIGNETIDYYVTVMTAKEIFEFSKVSRVDEDPKVGYQRFLSENLAMAKLHGEAGDLQEEQAQLRQLLKYFKFPLPNLQAPSDDSMRVAAQARLRTVQLLVAQDENEEAQRQWVQVLQLLRHHQLETDMQSMVERTRELLGPLARISFASRHYKSIELTGVWMSMPSFLLAPAPEDAAEGVYAA